MFNVDLNILMDAVNWYKSCGYKPLSVPYLVSPMSSALTKPEGACDVYHKELVYVASAEQSFIELYNKGLLQAGKYMAITPCVRDDLPDYTHQIVFLKLELIHVGSKDYNKVLEDSFCFMCRHHNVVTEFISETQTDIVNKETRLEYGSYGLRQFHDGTYYSYGTGVAFPRFCQ